MLQLYDIHYMGKNRLLAVANVIEISLTFNRLVFLSNMFISI